MKRFRVSWLTGTGLLARSWASIQPMKRLAADGAVGVPMAVPKICWSSRLQNWRRTGEHMVCDVHYSLCRWDVSLGHAVEMKPEWHEEVLVGYVGVKRSWWGMLVWRGPDGVCWFEEVLMGYVGVKRSWWGCLCVRRSWRGMLVWRGPAAAPPAGPAAWRAANSCMSKGTCTLVVSWTACRTWGGRTRWCPGTVPGWTAVCHGWSDSPTSCRLTLSAVWWLW